VLLPRVTFEFYLPSGLPRQSKRQERATKLPSSTPNIFVRSLNKGAGAATLKFWVWASLVSQILIVATGGLVRLTGSGLGCPTWPKCTDANLVAVPEQGYHAFIEFGNRLLTFALAVIAVGTLVLVMRRGVISRELRLRLPAWILLLGIPAQAVLGGITVWTHLNPWFVGGHFILSAVMIITASVLVWRAYNLAPAVVPRLSYTLAPVVAVLGAIAVVVGVLVTGAGPHAGDATSPRNGLDLSVWEHYHSWPAYLLLAATAWQLFVLWRSERTGRVTGIVQLLLVVEVCQAIVGVAQARLGVPAALVEVHMLLASCLISLITFSYLANRVK
jgi:cytochrome c oxidase assembly protein subunit 15